MIKTTFFMGCLAAAASAAALKSQSPSAYGQMMAELEVEALEECKDIHKLAVNPGTPVTQMKKAEGKFEDSSFPAAKSSLQATGDEWLKAAKLNKITWSRVASDGKAPIIGPKGISSDDVSQGGLGNCWFLAAAMGVAEHPDRMKQIIVNQKPNTQGAYSFNFWNLGVPITVTIDDQIPMFEGRTLASRPGPQNA